MRKRKKREKEKERESIARMHQASIIARRTREVRNEKKEDITARVLYLPRK